MTPADGNVVMTPVADFKFDSKILEYRNTSLTFPDGYFSPGSPTGQSGIDRRSNANLNSLVVSETSPGFYLTLSITQEISQRPSSASAQATWTGSWMVVGQGRNEFHSRNNSQPPTSRD
jgi:hypothetical protein